MDKKTQLLQMLLVDSHCVDGVFETKRRVRGESEGELMLTLGLETGALQPLCDDQSPSEAHPVCRETHVCYLLARMPIAVV